MMASETSGALPGSALTIGEFDRRDHDDSESMRHTQGEPVQVDTQVDSAWN